MLTQDEKQKPTEKNREQVINDVPREREDDADVDPIEGMKGPQDELTPAEKNPSQDSNVQ